MEKVCRLCGESSSRFMYNIFNKNEYGQQIIKLINQCLPILIYRSDPLSKDICTTCYTKLNEFSSFQNNSLKVHVNFKENLYSRFHESPVKLYINSLENTYQLENNNLSTFQSSRLVRNNASQIQVETRSNFTSTLPELSENLNVPTKGSLKILTPLIINEKSSNETILFSLLSQDGSVQKKRKLAGPKSKTRIQQIIPIVPPTLLQCALKQINRNLNLLDEFSTSDNTSETAMETETSEYSISRSVSQDRDVFTPEIIIEPDLSLMFDSDVDINEPVMCNYCMKNVNNMVDLAQHEINHMKVDIGPKVDSKLFRDKCRKVSSYYQNYLARIAGSTPSPIPRREIRVRSELRQITVLNHPIPASKPFLPVVDENSLLVPKQTVNKELIIEDYQILVEGTPLKEMSKEERKVCYKDMLINGIKRKFCPLCRHTFKDNWAIEYHYINDICQYTCKYCGRKFKHQKELFESHLLNHKNEPINKIFGPADRRHKLKKKLKRNNRGVIVARRMINTQTMVKQTKMKQLMHKKLLEPEIQIKTEPSDDAIPSASNIRTRTEPYQAYFCRKCFKVFFNVGEYNLHIQACTGPSKPSKSDTKSVTSETSSVSETQSRRPVRSCVKEISSLNDSEIDSDENSKKSSKYHQKSVENGFECGVCCSSFPSRQSRNSHMRIHKGQQNATPKPVVNKIAPKSHTITRQEPQVSPSTNYQNADIRLTNLNPAVARLVQNNPHLTIRTYSKSQAEKYQQEQIRNRVNEPPKIIEQPQTANETTSEHNIKRVYKCADCEDKFENKSILYYHKMNSCIVKRHYECAFCRKKFGTYDQYNTHMFYVHPE